MQKVNFLGLVQAVCPKVQVGGLMLDVLLPFPCACHYIIYGKLWGPSKFIFSLVIVGIDGDDIAWSSVTNGIIQLYASTIFERLDGFKYGNPIS